MSTTDVRPTRTRTTTDGAADPYDHAISLVDTTVPKDADEQDLPSLSQKPTRSTVRQQLTKNKYAKYQQRRYSSHGNSINSLATDPQQTKDNVARKNPEDVLAGEASETDVADFAEPNPLHADNKKKPDKRHKRASEQPYEVDILYENQRGWFFFGIPLYSHSSLLNFDPGPWVTKDFKDSAVDITNAQVPDPSWTWSWKRWYVDMSYDVDEQGWQYSFSFGRSFTWHGTHPWFHSFVRRRRWLRKRVKRQDVAREKDGSLDAAHKLTGDYFTIHSKRDRSPASVADEAAKTARPASYISVRTGADVGEPPEDISNIPNLLRALRFAKIDREKIDLVKRFIEEGGEELAYLGDHIPEIMSFMVFQNSRRQLLSFLKQTAQDAQKHREEHEAEERPEGDIEGRRINNLLSAIEAADGEIRGLEYWSDRKHVLRTAGDKTGPPHSIRSNRENHSGLDDNPVGSIKGIPENAEVTEDPTSTVISPPPEKEIPVQDKGKGKAVDDGDEKQYQVNGEKEEVPRLKFDSVFIPDEDAVNGDH